MWPHFGHVEDVPLVGLGLAGVHHLHVDIPDGVVALFNSLEEVLDEEIRFLPGQLHGCFTIKIPDSNLRLDVNLDILETTVLSSHIASALYVLLPQCERGLGINTYLFREFVGMPAVGVHMAERGRGSSITKEVHELVDAFRIADVETITWWSLQCLAKWGIVATKLTPRTRKH